MVVLAIAGIIGSIGGQYVIRTALDSIGTKASHETLAGAVETEPPIYEGPSFSVRLPAPVKVDTIEEDSVTLTMHGHETGDGIVAVAVADIPPDSAVDLQAAAEGVALNVGGRIVSQTPTEVAGRPASDIVISGVEGPELGTGWIRIIVDDSRLYEIMALQAGEHTEPPAAYQKAVDTFVLR
jgi:hypothetical protein